MSFSQGFFRQMGYFAMNIKISHSGRQKYAVNARIQLEGSLQGLRKALKTIEDPPISFPRSGPFLDPDRAGKQEKLLGWRKNETCGTPKKLL